MRLTFFVALLVTTLVISCIGFTTAENVGPAKNVDNSIRRLRLSADVQEERGAGDTIAKMFSEMTEGATKNAGKRIASAKEAAKLSDDQVAILSKVIASNKAKEALKVSDDEVAKFAMSFAAAQKRAGLTDDQVLNLSKIIADAKKVKEAAKVSDDEAVKVSDMFKKANTGVTDGAKFTNDELAKLGKSFTPAQKRNGLSDEQVANMEKMFTEMKEATKVSNKQVATMSQELAEVAKKDKKSWSTLKKVIVGTLDVTVGGSIIYGVYKLNANDAASTTTTTGTSTSG